MIFCHSLRRLKLQALHTPSNFQRLCIFAAASQNGFSTYKLPFKTNIIQKKRKSIRLDVEYNSPMTKVERLAAGVTSALLLLL
jgi:hypothetical protein